MSVELHDPNHDGLPWAVWVLKDSTGRPFMRGRDKAGLEYVMVAINEWQASRRALGEIVYAAWCRPVGKRYATARAIAKNALEGKWWLPVEGGK